MRIALNYRDRLIYVAIVEQREQVLACYTTPAGEEAVGRGRTVSRALINLVHELDRLRKPETRL